MTRLLIIDDHAVVRSGLQQFLSGTAGFARIGEAANGATALTMLDAEAWDLVLLDIGLPDINGIELLRRIKRIKPALPVLIFSMSPEDEQAMTCLEAGASGYLPKDSMPNQILDAISTVRRGERYLSALLKEHLIAGNGGARALHEALSPREHEVLLLLSRGVALTEIGNSLNLSPKTITTYRARILEKLHMGCNAELTRYVLKHKLTD